MQFDESDDTATGILPSNKSFRPTQGALRHSDDTELCVDVLNCQQRIDAGNGI